MNPLTLKQTLHEIARQGIPDDRDLWPEIQLRMQIDGAGASQPGDLTAMQKKYAHRKFNTAALAIVVILSLVVVTLVTPQGRAWAQQVLHFFSLTETESFPLSPAQMTAAAPPEIDEADTPPTAQPPPGIIIVSDLRDCDRSDGKDFYLCTVRLAETLLDYPIKGIPADSDILVFSSLQVEPQRQVARLSYAYLGFPGTEQSLWVDQGLGDFHDGSEWGKVPAEAVKPVTVGAYQGEYVQGAFIARPGATQAAWETQIPIARLRWKEGDRWYEIFKAGQPEQVTQMDQEGMVALAESLIYLTR